MIATETGYAKINLALHVRRRRPDGYHELETIFAFAEDGDRLSFSSGGAGYGLAVEGPFAESLQAETNNLVLRAARALAERFPGETPAGGRFMLDKRLPVAAGIGGGSADAAAALRLLHACRDDAALLELAEGLGADVAACLDSRTCRGEGVGEQLGAVAAEGLAGMPLLLVNPRVACPTGPVFGRWDGIDRGALGGGDPLAAALAGRNDLEPPARALLPAIGDVLAALGERPGAVLARMSGSGATCFALFDTDRRRDEAARTIASARPDWWCLATRLR